MSDRYRTLPDRHAARSMAGFALLLTALGIAVIIVVQEDLAGANASDLALNTWLFNLGETYPWMSSLSGAISFLADGARNIWTVPIVVIVLLIARRWSWAVFLIVVSQGGLLLSNALKFAISRERPPFVEQTAGQMHLSFPSGHAFSGMTVWVAYALILFFLLPRPWSTILGWIAVAIGILQGPARLILGKHWVTDVLASWFIAGAWLLAVWAAFCWWNDRSVQTNS